jgi:hypothetical protein
MNCHLFTVLKRVAPTATQAFRVGACLKLVCGALVTVLRMTVCVPDGHCYDVGEDEDNKEWTHS